MYLAVFHRFERFLSGFLWEIYLGYFVLMKRVEKNN